MVSPVLRSGWRIAALLLALAVVTAASQAAAPSFPSNVIRIVVGSNPSSPPDIISRIIATELAESEGWRVVVENKPGAIYTIAAAEVLRQPAEGHSIWAVPTPATVAPALLPNMSFRLESDFAPVIKFSRSYNVLVVHPSVPAKSLSAFVNHLKSNPDKLTFSSGGFGTPAHMIGEMFKLETGVRATHVPYPGGLSRAIADLLNGTNQFQFITTLPVVDLIASDKLRALAVTGPKRVLALRDVPTVVEQGFPNLVVEDWVGFAVKRGTPTEVVFRLNAALNKALSKEKVREALAKVGAQAAGGSTTEFHEFIKSQIGHWGKVVKDSGIKIQQ